MIQSVIFKRHSGRGVENGRKAGMKGNEGTSSKLSKLLS